MQYEDDEAGTHFLAGVLIGAVLGAAAAILMAPQSGHRTRRRIKRVAGDLRVGATDRWEDLADDLKQRVDETVKTARKRLPR